MLALAVPAGSIILFCPYYIRFPPGFQDGMHEQASCLHRFSWDFMGKRVIQHDQSEALQGALEA